MQNCITYINTYKKKKKSYLQYLMLSSLSVMWCVLGWRPRYCPSRPLSLHFPLSHTGPVSNYSYFLSYVKTHGHAYKKKPKKTHIHSHARQAAGGPGGCWWNGAEGRVLTCCAAPLLSKPMRGGEEEKKERSGGGEDVGILDEGDEKERERGRARASKRLLVTKLMGSFIPCLCRSFTRSLYTLCRFALASVGWMEGEEGAQRRGGGKGK